MKKDDYEFWNGIGKGVDLSLEVLTDELKNAEESAKPVISRLMRQLKVQNDKINTIKS